MEVEQKYLTRLQGDDLSILAASDIDQDNKPELLVPINYNGSISVFKNDLKSFLVPKAFSFQKGELSVIVSADLNHNGINEIIYGHRYVDNHPNGPSLYIVEKVGNDYKVIWESDYLGMVSRFFLTDDGLLIFTDTFEKMSQKLYLLKFKNGKFIVDNSRDIEGYPVYVGQIGSINNGIVVCNEAKDYHGRLNKFGSHVIGISLVNYKIIEIESGRFKEVRTNINFPQKEIWDFEMHDIDGDGTKELILGVYNDKNADVEVYKAISTKFEFVSKFRTKANPNFPKGLILADLNGDGKKDILTFDGTWIRHEQGKFHSSYVLEKIKAKFDYSPSNMLAVNFDQDNRDEVVVITANVETFLEDGSITNIFESYLLNFSE